MRNKVKQFIKDFTGFFGLSHFTIDIDFPAQKDNLLADIDTETRYQRIQLNVYKRLFKDAPAEQRKTLIHELIHTVLHDLEMCAWDLRNDKAVSKSHIEHTVEATTSKLENMFDILLKDGAEQRKTYRKYVQD